MNDSKIKGSCLCGKVNYQYSGEVKVFQYCHCSRCRKFTGSAHASNIIIDPKQFIWLKGSDLVGWFEPKDTKHFATSFCKNCGSSLPWLSKSKKAMVIPAGTLDDDPQARPMHNIFCDSKAPWFLDSESLPKFDKLPVKTK